MGIIEGAGIALVFLLLGRFLPGRRKTPKLPVPPKPVCGCTHHYSMHDPETGACNATVAVDRYNKFGDYTGKEHKPCACLRYSGPEPLPSYYAPEIAGEAGE